MSVYVKHPVARQVILWILDIHVVHSDSRPNVVEYGRLVTRSYSCAVSSVECR